MLELIRLMKETCLPGILDKPAKHILVCTFVLISDKFVNSWISRVEFGNLKVKLLLFVCLKGEVFYSHLQCL